MYTASVRIHALVVHLYANKYGYTMTRRDDNIDIRRLFSVHEHEAERAEIYIRLFGNTVT